MNTLIQLISPLDSKLSAYLSETYSKEYMQIMYKIKHSNFSLTDSLDYLGISVPRIPSIPSFFYGSSSKIEKIQPLLNDFYLNRTQYMPYITKSEFTSNLYDFCFSYINLVPEYNFLQILIILFNNKLFKLGFLCAVVYLMQVVVGLVPNTVRSNTWVHKYIYKLSYKSMYINILLKVYRNIEHLITKFCITYSLNLIKFVSFTSNLYLGFVPNIIYFNGARFNRIYASLTVFYVLLGWILDFLSFMWMRVGSNMTVKYIKTWIFWYQRSLYGVIYVSWLIGGVISTNGIYFSIMSRIRDRTNIDLIMAIVGSIITYIFSNLWYFYGFVLSQQTSGFLKYLRNSIRNCLSTHTYGNRNSRYSLFINIWKVINNLLIQPNSFSYFSAFRRSLLEWFSFMGMVLSTYGTWGLYTTHAFGNLHGLYHIFIWIIPTLLSGYGLIYLETVRPRLSSLYYGLVYLAFWTSICFSSNSVLTVYITISNAPGILMYILPTNIVLAIIYSLPLYRANIEWSFIRIWIHLCLFVLLTYLTLISAGTIWYILTGM